MTTITENYYSDLRVKYSNIAGLRAIDYQFAEFIYANGSKQEQLYQAALLVSYKTGLKNAALDLKDAASRPIEDLLENEDVAEKPSGIVLPSYDEWIQVLSDSNKNIVGNGGYPTPLILNEDGLFYLYRYWDYEKRTANQIARLCEETTDLTPCPDLFKALFPDNDPTGYWQRVAAIAAFYNKFSVISGGPGTGKTTTIAKLLSLKLKANETLKVAMVAPTGKAADRLVKSIMNSMDRLEDVGIDQKLLDLIPKTASTIHRYLKYLPVKNSFRMNAKNQTDTDLLIVDEASMVSLPLFTHLIEALPETCSVILLGDKDQLASVETGCVFGDLSAPDHVNVFNESFLPHFATCNNTHPPEKLGTTKGNLTNKVVKLEHSYRFGNTSGIGYLSWLVNEANTAEDADDIMSFIKDRALPETASRKVTDAGKPRPSDSIFADIRWNDIPQRAALVDALSELICNELSEYTQKVSEFNKLRVTDDELKQTENKLTQAAREILNAFDTFSVLCAVNRGVYGVENLNKICEDALFGKKRNLFYSGRPVMILKNDHNQKLYNGDVGVILKSHDGERLAYFRGEDNQIRSFAPAFLPEFITAFAMTVHKSQGSEFDNVLMILPNKDSKILSKEIIYTGITRAKSNISIWCKSDVLKSSVLRTLRRTSGLKRELKRK